MIEQRLTRPLNFVCPIRFGLGLGHHGYDLLQLHVMYAPVDDDEDQTVLADPGARIIIFYFHQLAFAFDFKPEAAGHMQLVGRSDLDIPLNQPVKHSTLPAPPTFSRH